MNVSGVRYLGSAVCALVTTLLLAACGSSAPHERNITLTLIRHAESEANAANDLATTVPGPPLTPLGREQATKLAEKAKADGYDGVFASQMVRTQQTAAPTAKALGEQVTVLPGLNEISAGWFEGLPVPDTSSALLLGPESWLNGDRRSGIPGSVNGNQFNGAFTAAVQTIYESDDQQPVAFSSGLSIMMWTLLNARNGKLSLLTDHPLPNMGRVVLEGNPVTGWTLKEWDGITDFALQKG